MPRHINVQKYPVEFNLHSYDCDFTGSVGLPVLFRYMADAAWKSAEALGFGFSNLKRKNLFWALMRMHIKMDSFPKWGEAMVINTWPTGKDKLYCYRDFEILKADGSLCGQAASSWLALDRDTRKPHKTSDYYDVELTHPGNVFEASLKKIRSKADRARASMLYRVHLSDLDIHGHVNNSIYVRWIMDGYSKQFLENNTFREMEINFISEARSEEDVVLKTLNDKDGRRHHIVRPGDGAELCRALTVWEKRQP